MVLCILDGRSLTLAGRCSHGLLDLPQIVYPASCGDPLARSDASPWHCVVFARVNEDFLHQYNPDWSTAAYPDGNHGDW